MQLLRCCLLTGGSRLNKEDEILNHWNDMATSHGVSFSATIPDKYLKDIEIISIEKHLEDGMRILDLGCGNGYSCFLIRKHFDVRLKGIDYSNRMISLAKSVQPNLPGVEFCVGNAMELSDRNDCYDVVISERCIINLETWENQKQAIRECWRVLKTGGLLILAEAFVDPLHRLNALRATLGLSDIKQKWHNRYMIESDLFDYTDQMFSVELIDNYSSTYYLLTRAVSPKIGELEARETTYNDPINKVGSLLPPIGDYGPQKTIVLKKK